VLDGEGSRLGTTQTAAHQQTEGGAVAQALERVAAGQSGRAPASPRA
jgi:hypothetical protein